MFTIKIQANILLLGLCLIITFGKLNIAAEVITYLGR
jgi:hypothetical protein